MRWTDHYLGAAIPDKRDTSPPRPIVFIVDDDAAVRDSLERLAGGAGWHAETFASASEFLARSRASVPSCLVFDMWLPDVNGLDMQQRLADRPEMPIIFITGSSDVPTAVRAMKAGAFEFFTKPLADGMALTAMRCAIERSGAALARRTELEALRVRYASLTPRERDVMTLVVRGQLSKQVGAELGISEITVKAHRAKMMRKMEARWLPDLVTMATRLFAMA